MKGEDEEREVKEEEEERYEGRESITAHSLMLILLTVSMVP